MRKHPDNIIKKIKKLRRNGYSISDLMREFSLPKTTIWHHINNIKVPKKYIALIKSRQGGSKIRSQKEWTKADSHAKELLKNRKNRYHCSLLATLYWAEGSKGAFSFVNTDGQMIQIYLNILRKYFNIGDDDIVLTLRTFSNLNLNEGLRYWSGMTGFPKESFKVYINDGGRKGKAKYGMCKITVKKSGYLHKLIISLINNIIKENIE